MDCKDMAETSLFPPMYCIHGRVMAEMKNHPQISSFKNHGAKENMLGSLSSSYMGETTGLT